VRKYIYIIGYPVRDTAARGVFQAACDYLNLGVRCEEWEFEDAAELQQVADYLRREEVLGAIVTMPYKESVIPLIDGLDDEAQRIGAINTIFKHEGKLIGHNADAMGFLQSLIHEGGFDPKGKQAVILGAGGAARACGIALAGSGVRAIVIVNRTLSRGYDLASILKTSCFEVDVMGYDDDKLAEAIQRSELLVNCTSFGMKYSSLEGKCPIGELIPRGQTVYDVVYKPMETPLLKMAREAGAKTMNGLGMVVRGSADSFKLFTNQEPPIALMFDTARKMAEEHGW
jgi:shikimate dehydrogenase